MGKWIAWIGWAVLLTLTSTAEVDAARSGPVRTPLFQDIVDPGRQSFVVSCAFCHGIDARGGESGPDLLRSDLMLSDREGDLLGPFLEVGRPDLGMPAFQMGANEVSGLALFIRGEIDAVIERGDYEIQNVVTGDAARGETYFNGEGGCSGCHSADGDLAGIAKRFTPPDLLSRIVNPGRGGRGSRPLDRTVTVTFEEGETIQGVLAYIDDFTVGLRTNAGVYRSFSLDDVTATILNPYSTHIDLLSRYTDRDLHDVLTYLVSLQ